MGGIANMVGNLVGGGSPNNANFQAQAANLQQPTTADMATNAYNSSLNGISQQQQLANALANQGGLQNQSGVYSQLQGIANGTGPNPAQAMLNQTGQNVANQAALMAGQHGAGANVGLMARQAAQQGANTQQQAVGQGALLQAQQALGALGQMGNMANTQVANQMAGTNNLNQMTQGEYQQLLNSINAQNQANVGMTGNMNQVNAQMAAGNAQRQAGLLGYGMNALGSLFVPGSSMIDNANQVEGGDEGDEGGSGGSGAGLGMAAAALAKGGEVGNPKLDRVPEKDRFQANVKLPPHLQDIAAIYHPHSFGNRYPHKGYDAGGKVNMKQGGKVPGEPKTPKKDTPSNDTVPAMLTPKEVVLPLSVTQSKNPVNAAAKFMASVLAKQGKGKTDHKSEFKEALNRAIKERKTK